MSRRAGIAKARDCKNSEKTINCTKMPIKLPRRGLVVHQRGLCAEESVVPISQRPRAEPTCPEHLGPVKLYCLQCEGTLCAASLLEGGLCWRRLTARGFLIVGPLGPWVSWSRADGERFSRRRSLGYAGAE